MPDLTSIFANINDIERNLEKDESLTLELYQGSKFLARIENGWFVETIDFRRTGGKKFKQLSILDPDRKYTSALANFDVAKLGSRRLKVSNKDEPEDQTREWIIELQPTGASPA